MKKRILFVDDDPMLLNMYRLMLQIMSNEWEVGFAGSAKEGLQLMAEQPFDVVISDMRMPEMNGAQFLNEVMKRHPRTSRVILSGYADQESVAQCVGATHQYLSKPCNLNTLRSTIARICAIDAWLGDEKLKSLVARIGSLPSIPSIYYRVLKALETADTATDQIADIIAQDPAMTAKILQLVNSAFFGIPRQISNPLEAVQMLGVGTIRCLTLSLHLFNCFDPSKLKSFSIGELWNHSMSVGLVAKRLARIEDLDQAAIDECYVGGMLHEIGKLMLAAGLPALYDQAIEISRDRAINLYFAERQVFGATHSEVGAYLLGLWGLPAPVVEVLLLHHDPAKSPIRELGPLTIVHFANVIEREISGVRAGGASSMLDMTYLAELGLHERLPAWRTEAHRALRPDAA
jgi:HD-like signal output (HDOD) protein